MLDEDFNLIFLEANGSPRLKDELPGEDLVSPRLAKSVVDIVL